MDKGKIESFISCSSSKIGLSLFNIIYTRGYRTGYCNIHAQLRNMLKQQFIS